MASIEDIKKLLESKSFTSARDLDELEEKPDDKQNEVRLNCEPMIGMVEKEGKTYLQTRYGDFPGYIPDRFFLINLNAARLACRQLGVKDADFYQALSEYSVSLLP